MTILRFVGLPRLPSFGDLAVASSSTAEDSAVTRCSSIEPSDAQLDALTNNQLLRIPASNYVAFEAETYSKCVSCHRGKKGVNHGCASCMHPFCVCLDASLADFGVC